MIQYKFNAERTLATDLEPLFFRNKGMLVDIETSYPGCWWGLDILDILNPILDWWVYFLIRILVGSLDVQKCLKTWEAECS